MVEVVMGFLIAWATRKVRRIGGAADGLFDHGIDVVKQRLQEAITAKLGGDTAYQRFQLEAAERGEVSPLTEERVRLALKAAIEEDRRFAAELHSVVNQIHVTRTTGERSIRDNNGRAAYDSSVIVEQIHGNVWIQPRPATPPPPPPPAPPLTDRMRSSPENAAVELQTMGIDQAARALEAIAWHRDGRRPAAIVVACLPTDFAAQLLDRVATAEAAKILNECRAPGRTAAILLAMTRQRAIAVMSDTSTGSSWWQGPVTRELKPATAVAFLEEIGYTGLVADILTRLEPAAVVSIVRTLPAERQKEIRDHFSDRKRYDPHAKRVHLELRRSR
ncbi:hypothetical protein [Amycolatopsis sp. SID8362]|uniref:hypothetical protein n=1 Tax=Amycolatopsis sp. SID8362 TaxID=2690346 RepID=UPI00136BFD99|nr:hypothetical protein [Amycolatopsis sp. SID8362]NBH03499.1 hypothetical protein [Amycolatopsis sp. SID8362]NED40199.1 hypothetical protein [Amycolatopsis sp. SID8362]